MIQTDHRRISKGGGPSAGRQEDGVNGDDEEGDDDKDRFGEYGLVDATQKDESHLDGRNRGNDDEENGRCDQEIPVVGASSDDDDEKDEEDGLEMARRGRIRFSKKKLYGREDELGRLKALFKVMLQQPPAHNEESEDSNSHEGGSKSLCGTNVTKAVFVSGFSGSGKSALVKQFVDDVRKSARRMTGSQCHDQVLFLRAKYEKTQSSAPFSAFSTLFDQIPLSLTKEFRHVCMSLRDSLGDDVDVLQRIFPQLRYLLHGQSSRSLSDQDDNSITSSLHSISGHVNNSRMMERQQLRVVQKSRLKFAISALFRALCDHLDNRPLILYVDDLQWADQSGLELLQNLISDDALQYLFFIGAYRSNEIGDNPYFERMIQAMRGKVAYESFYLGEISPQATGELISDSLGLPLKEVEPLTKAVFAKSLGNPLHIRQALEHLVRRNALYYDTVIFSWAWNLGDRAGSSNSSSTTKYLEDLLADDILEMVKSKIQHMPNQDLKRILATASLVRASFDVDTLLDVQQFIDRGSSLQNQEAPSGLTGGKTEDADVERRVLVDQLNRAVGEGLLVRISSSARREDKDFNTTYAFSHDRIQEAAASFAAQENSERELFLVHLGMGLLRRAQSDHGEDWMYFAAARHLNSVATTYFLAEKDLLLNVVELNLETAQLSLCLLAFSDAVGYVQKGLALLSELGEDFWETQYDFAVELHCIGAQAELGGGNPGGADSYCKTVFSRMRDILSAIPAYKVHLDILGGKGDHEGALKLIISVLDELGVKIPKSNRGKRVKAWTTLQYIKAGHIPTQEKIQNMPSVSDIRAAATMEMIQKAIRFSIATYPELYVLLCCEGIRWMNKYGLSETSGASMASFANVVMHKFSDFKTGIRLAELAIFIVDRQNNKFNETQALNTANQNVLSWVRPIKSRLPYHVRAYESGMTSGNLEGACVGKWHTFWNLYHSSAPLAILEDELRIMSKKVTKWGFQFFKSFYSMIWQLVQNLMGKSENTTFLIGNAMDEREELWSKMPHNALLATFKSYAMVVFGDFEHGAIDALNRGNSYNEKMPGMQYGMEPFYRGISLYAMARKVGDKKYKAAARQVRKLYQIWVKKGCVNLVGFLKVLDAEDLALSGRKNSACKKYEDAIAILVNGGFYSNAGVACERYGYHLVEIGQKVELRGKLLQAKSYYGRWGATRKVEQLNKQLEKLQASSAVGDIE